MVEKRAGIQTHIVLLVCGRWWVDIEGKGFGPCRDQADACKAAIDLAQVFGEPDRKREVVLVRPDGGHEQIWSSFELKGGAVPAVAAQAQAA